jgi:hypothetical protein
MVRMRIAIAACAALFAGSALAQAPATTPVRVRGTIEKLDGQTLTVKSRDGQSLTLALAPNYTVSALVKKTIADVKPNDYIASSGLKGTDGKIHATELRIFPEAQRGTAEGQFPWDSQPDTIMTNATVTGTAQAVKGQVLTVTYKGTTSDFIVDPETPIFGYVQGDPGLLKAGAAIFTVAQKAADGSLTAARITAEKDGVKPPM